MSRCAAAVLVTLGMLALSTPVAVAQEVAVSPWAVGEQMQRVDDVTWDAAGDALLVSGNPVGDETCCIKGLWLAHPDGSGTRLDAGGAEIRGASISPDGRTMAWITPAQQVGQTRVVVVDASGTKTVTRLPVVEQSEEPYYTNTLVGPTGRVFALMNAYSGWRIVEIPRGGRGRIMDGQPRLRYVSSDAGVEQAVLSPDGRVWAFCTRLHGHNVAGTLDAATGTLRAHRVARGYLGDCGVTDGGTLVTTVARNGAHGRLMSRLDVLPSGHPRRHYLIPYRDLVAVGPHALLVGLFGRRLLTVPESGNRLRRIATPRKFRVSEGEAPITAWSADGGRAAVAYPHGRATRNGCLALDHLLIVDVARRRTLRHLTAIPGAQRKQSVDDMRFTADAEHVLATASRACRGRDDRAWAVGATSGKPVDLNGGGFAYTGTWNAPGVGALVAQDRSRSTSGSSALGLVGSTAHLGTGPLMIAGG